MSDTGYEEIETHFYKKGQRPVVLLGGFRVDLMHDEVNEWTECAYGSPEYKAYGLAREKLEARVRVGPQAAEQCTLAEATEAHRKAEAAMFYLARTWHAGLVAKRAAAEQKKAPVG